ncbi:DUF4158 domain-containing protein [Nonomuraea sp. K274]|uniref:DUF4158 domain-containing protein n=1 Tax=Nonomuraea cypriaca TaxID=1187855 RepID=A0A931EWE1_9ACTN|nr:DUF4158 domain-containing protein [Nonomuraea cypriaca]
MLTPAASAESRPRSAIRSLSDEQIVRYERFPEEPSLAELEQFFRLDRAALEALAAKRRPATRLGWAVQCGTVRMLGMSLTKDPLAVPPGAVAFVAEQLRRTSPTTATVSRPSTSMRRRSAFEEAECGN